MERTGVMGERMFEIKKKQSEGRDGQIDNMKQRQREEGEGDKKRRREMRGASEVVDGGEQ